MREDARDSGKSPLPPDHVLGGQRTGRPCFQVLLLVSLAGLEASCGGGSGGGSSEPPDKAALSVSPLSLAVTASTVDSPPQATVHATILSAASGTTYYIAGENTSHAIQAVNLVQNGNGIDLNIQFIAPGTLGEGTYADTLTVRGCRDSGCTSQIAGSPQTVQVSFTVTPPRPSISQLTPSSATAGAPAFTLAVTGQLFTAQSVLRWGGSARTTTFVDAYHLTAQIPVSDVAAAGSVAVTVVDGTQESAPATFTVNPLPALSVTRIWPTHVPAGSPGFNARVVGEGFSAASVIQWNGSPLPTTYVSSTMLAAAVDAALIAAPGTAQISVANPPAQGGLSPPSTLTIDPRSIESSNFQINAGHTGAIAFQSVTLPNAPAWQVDLGGTPTYALVAGGRVYAMAQVSGSGQLSALSAVDGHAVWGPILFGGAAYAAYDAGSVFVVSGSGNSAQVLTALDAATGTARWSATVPGGWFPEPPVAEGGIVYTVNSGEVTAFDESTGAQLWLLGIGGTSGTVAATVDGVYGSAPCTSVAMDPLAGTVLWTTNTGCSGGGGNTPLVADGGFYSPIGGSYQGNLYDSATGGLLGNFAASTNPAATSSSIFWLANSTLRAVSRANNQVLWSFAGDGTLVTPPLVVSNTVFVGSGNGNLYGLDATSGQLLWTQALPSPFSYLYEGPGASYSSFAAGEGLLVVPNGTSVTTYLISANP